MTKTTKLTGRDALALARLTGCTLNVYANEVEIDGREDVPLADAEKIAREDVSLLWCEVPTLTVREIEDARRHASNAGDDEFVATCVRALAGEATAIEYATRIVRIAQAAMVAESTAK